MFKIIDCQTEKEADARSAGQEDWARNLAVDDIEGFAVTTDGAVVLIDECGACAMAPGGRYRVENCEQAVTADAKSGKDVPMTMDELFALLDGAAAGEDIWVWLEITDPERAGTARTAFPDKPGYVRACRQWKDSNDGVALWSGSCGILFMVKDGAGDGWNVYREKPEQNADVSAAPQPLTREYLISLMDKAANHGEKEWVWIEPIGDGESKHISWSAPVEAGYYRAQKDYTDGETFCCGWPGVGFCFEFEEMGTVWQAYRFKPENSGCDLKA